MTAAGVATVSFASTALRVLSPVLAFLSRLAIPVTVITAAFKLLMATIDQGASLLDKYGNAQRDLVGGVDENLAKLTKFQDGNLSAEQVQRATELGARLNDAKKTIDDFFRVQLDLNDAGLKLQAVWVRIVELVAAAVDKLNSMPQWAISMMLGAATGAAVGSVVPVIGTGVGAVAGGVAGVAASWGMGGDSASASNRLIERRDGGELNSALGTAYDRLRAGMGSQQNFANRFGGDINALANVGKETDKAKKSTDELRDAYDRASDQVTKNIAVMEANAKAVGLGAAEQEKLRTQAVLTEAAMRSGGTEAVKQHADEIERLSQRAADAAQSLARIQIQNQIGRDRSFAAMSQEDVQIANQLQRIYPDITTALNSQEAQYIRTTNRIRDMRDAMSDFASGFARDMRNSATATEALGNALNRLADKLIDMAVNNLVSNALGGSGGGGLLGFLGLGGSRPMSLAASGSGTIASSGMGSVLSSLYHTGGIVGETGSGSRYVHPAYFDDAPRYHGGGLAGLAPDEVPAILRRGEPVFPSVAAAAAFGGGSTTVNLTLPISSGSSADGADVVKSVRNYVATPEFEAIVIAKVRQAKSERKLS
jgi:hypothetical protein